MERLDIVGHPRRRNGPMVATSTSTLLHVPERGKRRKEADGALLQHIGY